MPVLLHLILFLIPSPTLLSHSTSAPSESQPVKMVISEQCVSDPNEVQGHEVDLTPGSPLVLTHRIRLVSSPASGSCCQTEFGALRERIEVLEKELSELREKCGGLDGGCCTSQQSKGVGCSTDQCLNGCSDQGSCVDGKCVCFPGFSGPDCSVSNCPGDCSNKGKCVNGECVCDPGFSGPDCSHKACPKNCSNHGRCVNGRCVCNTGFTGPDCSGKSCPGNCNNKGRCVNGKCVCDTGFTGPDCSEKSCPGNCNKKGKCVDGRCVCNTGFTGPDCSEKSCPGNCNNKGRCVNGKCVCDEGFKGPDCSEKSCPGNCNNKGRCVDGRCVCHAGFTGLDCSERTCPENCNDNGRCVDGKCVCDTGFTGLDCSERSCPGNCNNKGRCVDGKCVCDTGFTGPDCSIRSCPDNCSNRGRCVNGQCVCDVGFTGQDCSTKSCPNNCSNRGRCVNGKCVCNPGFAEPDCSECNEGLTGPDCATALIAVSYLDTRNITESSVTVFWTPPTVQYNSYLLTFTSEKESDQKITTTVDGRIRAYTQVGLAPGQRYTVTIIGEKDGRMGTKSTTTFQTLISGPKNLQVVKTSTTSVIVQWEEAQGEIDRYILSISPNQTDGSGKGRQDIRVPPGRDSAQIDNLEPGRLYDISLVAVKDGTQSLPATVQATPGINTGLPDPGSRTTRGSGGKLANLRLKKTSKGSTSEYEPNIDSSREQDPDSSRNFVEPTVTTERNLTAHGLNGIKYIRRVLLKHRKGFINRDLYGNALTRNMTVGHVSRNDILTNIPDRLVGFSDGVRPLDGKRPKLQDRRFEEYPIKEGQEENQDVHQQEEGALEMPSFSEQPERMSRNKMEAGTTPSPSLPLAATLVQPFLVPSKTQDHQTNRRLITSRDRHDTKTSIQLPPSFKHRYSGRPKLSSPTLRANRTNNRQPTAPISSTISSQIPEHTNPVGNVSSLQTSYTLGMGKETLNRKTTASQKPQPDNQGLLTESVQGLDRGSSADKLPKGVKDTENRVSGEYFPKHKETINKTLPLYHRTSHRGIFPHRPNTGPFQNRTSPSQHPFRSPLRRPLLHRVNSTARFQVEPGIINSRQGFPNPNHTRVFTWQMKNGSVIRSPPKPFNKIKPNLQNGKGSKADVTVEKNAREEPNILLSEDDDADPILNISLSTDNGPSKKEDIIKPVSKGSENTIDHILPRVTYRDNTTRQNVPHHQRGPGVFRGRQNASSLKIRPTFIQKKKNNTVIRLPSKLQTGVNVNSTTTYSPLKDGKYESRHKLSEDASRESLITASTEKPPTGTTLQTINEGSKNTIDHTNKENNLHQLTITSRNLSRATNIDQNPLGDDEISKIATREHTLPRNRDNTTMQMLIDKNVRSEIISHRGNIPNPSIRSKFIFRRKNGTQVRIQPKLHSQTRPNSTIIHQRLKEEDTKVVEDAKKSGTPTTDIHPSERNNKLQSAAVDSETGSDNILPRITNRDQHMSRVTEDKGLPSNTNRDDRPTVTQLMDQNVPPETFSGEGHVPNQSHRPTIILNNSGRSHPKPHDQIKHNSTTIQSGLTATDPRAEKVSKETTKFTDPAVDVGSEADPPRITNREYNNYSQKAPSSNFTAMTRRNNGTVFRHKPKPEIKPNLHRDTKQSTERNTTRTTSQQKTINRNSGPNTALHRKTGTSIRTPPKVPPLSPNSTTVHDATGGSKTSRDDPKLHWSTEVPLSKDKATRQRNITFPPATEDSISHVGFQNVTSKGFIIVWVAPEGRFKNFVIRIKEEIDEGVNEGDGNKQDERKERTEGNEVAANGIDVRSSTNGVRKKFIKLLPGSARSYPATDLTSQTNYSVTLYGTSPGLRSNIHTFIIITGPEPPTHLSFSDITDTSLTVSWKRPKSSVSGFKVTYVHTKEGEPISVMVDSSRSTLSLTKLSPGSQYEVSVISVLGLDESDAIKDMVVTLPDPPTNLRAINITDSKALLLWRPALAAVDQYIITYHPEEAPGSDSSVRVSGNAVEQQLQSLKASTKYMITIISQLGDQKSSSTHTTFTTTSGSPGKGEPPRDLTAKHVTARTALLSWKPPASAVTSYKLTYFTKGGERKEVILNPGDVEHKLRGLRPSSTYTALLQGERGGVYTASISTEFTTGTLRFPYPSDCSQEQMNGELDSGVVEIFPGGKDGQPVMVYCDMETDGGGWTVFQRRKDGKTNFFRGWQEYRKGFGDLEGEFWLGNDFLHNLTKMTPMNMRVDLRSENDSAHAQYSTFSVDTMKKHYMLRLSGYSGTAGDSLRYHDKRPFSTYDRDPQPFITRCAMSYRGGWWYMNCHEANLNGLYNTHTNHQGVIWTTWKGKKFSIPFTEMKLRPASFRPHSQG